MGVGWAKARRNMGEGRVDPPMGLGWAGAKGELG